MGLVMGMGKNYSSLRGTTTDYGQIQILLGAIFWPRSVKKKLFCPPGSHWSLFQHLFDTEQINMVGSQDKKTGGSGDRTSRSFVWDLRPLAVPLCLEASEPRCKIWCLRFLWYLIVFFVVSCTIWRRFTWDRHPQDEARSESSNWIH